MILNFLKRNIKVLLLIKIIFMIFYIPCYYYSFIEPYFLEFKIACVVLIYYGSTLNTNISLLITILILLVFYKIHKLCGIENVLFS